MRILRDKASKKKKRDDSWNVLAQVSDLQGIAEAEVKKVAGSMADTEPGIRLAIWEHVWKVCADVE